MHAQPSNSLQNGPEMDGIGNRESGTNLVKLFLEGGDHVLLDNDVLVVEVLDDVVVVVGVDVDDDGLDGGVALDEDS